MLGNPPRGAIGDMHHNMNIERCTNFKQDHDVTRKIRIKVVGFLGKLNLTTSSWLTYAHERLLRLRYYA